MHACTAVGSLLGQTVSTFFWSRHARGKSALRDETKQRLRGRLPMPLTRIIQKKIHVVRIVSRSGKTNQLLCEFSGPPGVDNVPYQRHYYPTSDYSGSIFNRSYRSALITLVATLSISKSTIRPLHQTSFWQASY